MIKVFDYTTASVLYCIDNPLEVVYDDDSGEFVCALICSPSNENGCSYVELKFSPCHYEVGSDGFYDEARRFEFYLTEVNSDA